MNHDGLTTTTSLFCTADIQASLPEQNGIAKVRLVDETGVQIATSFVGIWLGETRENRVSCTVWRNYLPRMI